MEIRENENKVTETQEKVGTPLQGDSTAKNKRLRLFSAGSWGLWHTITGFWHQ
jgi:hypothetical protein